MTPRTLLSTAALFLAAACASTSTVSGPAPATSANEPDGTIGDETFLTASPHSVAEAREAAARREAEAREAAASTAGEPAAATATAAAPGDEPFEAAPPRARRRTAEPWITSADLAVWQDPRFRQRFVQSYLAETDVEPTMTQDERATLLEVTDHIFAEEPGKAKKLLSKEGGPQASAAFDFMLGNIHFQADELEPAATAYEAAVEKYPKFRRAWKNLAIIRVRLNEHAKALEAFTNVIELGGADSVTYGLLGFCHSNVENHMAAESAYRMAMLLDPVTWDWKMGLVQSFFRQQRWADAVAMTETLLQERPESTDLWLIQANAYIGLKQPMDAARNYELVDRLGGSTPDSLNMLGDVYVNEELFEQAVASYLKALRMAPEKGPARALRAARVLVTRGALGETRALLEELDALPEENLATEQRQELLKMRARLAVAEGAGDEHVAVLEEVVALDPLDGEALILLAQHEERSGNEEKAMFLYDRAAAIEAFEAEAKTRKAQILVRRKRYDEALPLLRRAQALAPRDSVQDFIEDIERVSRTR